MFAEIFVVIVESFFLPVLAAIESNHPVQLLFIALSIYCLAGIVKGMLGIGFPTAAVSLMAQVVDARTAIIMVIMPMLFTNCWQVIRSRKLLAEVAQIKILLVSLLIFIAIFSQLASRIQVNLLTVVLGVIVALYALHSLFAKPLSFSDQWDIPAQLVAGIGAGIMGGLVSVWAPPILIYLHARRYAKEQFVAATGVILLTGSCVLFLSYLNAGSLSSAMFMYSLILVVPSLAGFAIGEFIRHRISAQRFQRLLLWFFFFMGLNLIRRVLM